MYLYHLISYSLKTLPHKVDYWILLIKINFITYVKKMYQHDELIETYYDRRKNYYRNECCWKTWYWYYDTIIHVYLVILYFLCYFFLFYKKGFARGYYIAQLHKIFFSIKLFEDTYLSNVLRLFITFKTTIQKFHKKTNKLKLKV